MGEDNPFLELPDTNPFLDLPMAPEDGETEIASEAAWYSAKNLNKISQGMSNRMLRGLTIGTSALLPDPSEEVQQNIAEFDEEHPIVGTVAEIVPAIAQGYGVIKGAQVLAPNVMKYVATKLPTWAQASIFGTVEGATYGASTAEEGETLKGGTVGAGLGAIAGPVGTAFAKIGGAVWNGLSTAIKTILADTPHAQAIRIIRSAIEAEDLSPEFIQAELKRLGPEARLVDVSEGLTRSARGAAALDIRSHGIADGFLNERQAGQVMRLAEAAGGEGFDPVNFAKSYAKWMASKNTAAGPLYKAAYESGLSATPRMEVLMKRPSIQAAMKKAANIVVEEGGGSGHVRFFDAVKRELDDRIGAAMRKGKKDEARRLINTKNALLEEIDAQVPDYKAARNMFAGEAQLKSAAEMGYETVSRGNKDLWVIEEALAQMGESEQHAFRLGALRGIIDKLDKVANTRNAAQKLIESNRAKQLLRIVFPDDEAAENFIRTAEAESTFSRTKNTITGGSPTSRIDEDKRILEEGVSAGSALLHGSDPITLATKFFKALGIGKPDPDALNVVAEMLFSRNLPATDAAKILQRAPVPNKLARSGAATTGAVVAAENTAVANSLVEERE